MPERQREIRYSDEVSNLWAPWHLVINQIDHKTSRSVGEIMQIIEMMGLPDKQESALKSKIKSILYQAANDSLDWISCASLKQEVEGKLQGLPEVMGMTSPVPFASSD